MPIKIAKIDFYRLWPFDLCLTRTKRGDATKIQSTSLQVQRKSLQN